MSSNKMQWIFLTVGFAASCLFFIFLGHSAAFAADDFELIARVEPDWAPIYYQENGQWKGMDIECYALLAKEAGIKLSFKDIPWSRALTMLQNGDPLIMSKLTPTEERKSYIHFVGPHETEAFALILDKKYQKEKIENLDDLAAFCKRTKTQISYKEDVFYSDEFSSRLDKDPEFRSHFLLMNIADNWSRMVLSGRISGYFEDRASASYNLLTNKEYHGKLVVHPFNISSTEVYFGLSKKLPPDILKKLDEANTRLLKKGAYKQIVKKWTGQ